MIAQDVQSVVPEVVTENGDGRYLAIDYPLIVPLLVEGINEIRKIQQQQVRDDIGPENSSVDELNTIRMSIANLLSQNRKLSEMVSDIEREFDQLKIV